MSEPALVDLLDRGLAELGIRPVRRELDALAQLASELERWGARINLTGHRDAETIARRLVLDAAALLTALPDFTSLADLGSGAGFPGLPMAVLAPQRRFVLVESRERRHFFQRDIIRKLELSNVVAVRGRFDVVEPHPSQVVVAQAVGSPADLVDALRRWAEPGGLLVVPGGESPRALALESGLEAQIAEYQVPLDGPRRTIWLAATPR